MRRPRGENELWGLALIAVVAVLCYGAYALYRDHVGKPDDSCYWQVQAGAYTWLIDTAPEKSCAPVEWAQQHRAFEGTNLQAADFAQKAGRRICGQVVQFCEAKR